MSLNCKPEQPAWICVPRTPQTEALGMVQLHGHVVVTKGLDPRVNPAAWVVEPQQSHRVVGPIPPRLVGRVKEGDKLIADCIPDAWLRPFNDLAPAEIEQLRNEINRELTS
jgi:hypothetical protein